jgi:hypothetical protein
VGTHHIARLIFVSLMMPFVVHAIRRAMAPKAAALPKPDDRDTKPDATPPPGRDP